MTQFTNSALRHRSGVGTAKRLSTTGILLVALCVAGPALAERDYHGFSIDGGVGLATAGGLGMGLIAIEAPFAFNEYISLGPQIQLAGSAVFISSIALNLRVGSELKFFGDNGFAKTRVFGQIGGGAGYATASFGGFGGSAWTGLINPGFGVEYPLTDRLWLNSNMTFNIPVGTPAPMIYAWRILGVRYQF